MSRNEQNNNTNKANGGPKSAGPRAPALDPRSPLLGQPFKRLVEEGFVTELLVKFTPLGVTVTGKPDARLAAVESSGLTVGQDAPVGMLSAAADKGNLIPRGKRSKSKESGPPKPAKSLTPDDFNLSEAEFVARARLVANNSGGNTLVGRVRSSGNFGGTVTTSFSDWWASASADAKASALILAKYRQGLNAEQIARVGGLQCPFRGTAEFTVNTQEAEESEDEEEEEQPPRRATPPQNGGKPTNT